MDIARFEIPVSGCTCLRTVDDASVKDHFESHMIDESESSDGFESDCDVEDIPL